MPRMVERGAGGLAADDLEILFLENVGNLVCPTSYDLGEEARAVLLSVTEGEDKPLKYPATFHHADVMVLNKIDLLPYVPFQVELAGRTRGGCSRRSRSSRSPAPPARDSDGWRAWIEAHL